MELSTEPVGVMLLVGSSVETCYLFLLGETLEACRTYILYLRAARPRVWTEIQAICPTYGSFLIAHKVEQMQGVRKPSLSSKSFGFDGDRPCPVDSGLMEETRR